MVQVSKTASCDAFDLANASASTSTNGFADTVAMSQFSAENPRSKTSSKKSKAQFMSKTETAINRQKTGTSLNAPHCKPQDSKRSYPKCIIHTWHVSQQMMSFWDIISCKQTFREMFRMRGSKDITAVWQFYHLLANIVSGRVDRMRPKQVSSVGLNQCGSTSHRGRLDQLDQLLQPGIDLCLDIFSTSGFGQNLVKTFFVSLNGMNFGPWSWR